MKRRSPLFLFCFTLSWFVLVATGYAQPTDRLFSAPPLSVSDPTSQGSDFSTHFRLADLHQYAYRHNPRIQAARYQWEAIVEQYRLAEAYPDPQLMVTFYPSPIETRLGPQEWNAIFSQKIPFPGKLKNKATQVAQESQIATIKLDKTVRDVITEVTHAYYELSYIQTAQAIALKNGELLTALRKISENGYAKNRAALVDISQATAQAGQLRYDLTLLEELEVVEKANLNHLLNRLPTAPLGYPATISVTPSVLNPTQLFQAAKQYQDALQMVNLTVEKAKTAVEQAKLARLPDFKLGLFYAGIGQPEGMTPPTDAGEDAMGIQFGVSIPLWGEKNDARIAQAQAKLRVMQAKQQQQRSQTQRDIQRLYFKLRNSERLVVLYRDDLLPQAVQAVQSAETWWREGQATLGDFIETQKAVYNFQLALARAQADQGQQLAALSHLVGVNVTQPIEAK